MISLATTKTTVENAIKIMVVEIVGDNLCIASGDGQKVYEEIAVALRKGKNVILSFKNAEDITPAFLSRAIAQLYLTLPEEQIESCLSIVELEPEDEEFLEYVIRDAKEYLENPQRFAYATLETLGADYLWANKFIG